MIEIKKHSGIYSFELQQQIPVDINTAWDFFSSPENLSRITPPKMGFSITSPPGGKMFPGQIISYRIGIFPFVHSNWVTEISHVVEKLYFVDMQLFGPYKMWHHQHFFRENDKGVLVTDRVYYKVPFGIFGMIAHTWFIKKMLRKIFEYRYRQLNKIFP
jgi:ligand-binding SRPBCC domain-containing protein